MKSTGYKTPDIALTTLTANTVSVHRLHSGHFAFMRAVVQGLNTKESWDRYLRVAGAPEDGRQIKQTIDWIRDAFAAAAKRNQRHGTARLVLLDLTSLHQRSSTLPTVGEFIRDHHLDDFSEHEQLELYKTHYPKEWRTNSRRARLVSRQLEALNWLQEAIAAAPRPTDLISDWLHPSLARHMAAANLHSLEQLVTHVRLFGSRWWFQIPAIGAAKASRINEWLRAYQATLALPAKVSQTGAVGQSDVPWQTQLTIKPLQQLLIPAALDGRHGALRAPRPACRITADQDLPAILIWLQAKRGRGIGPSTKASGILPDVTEISCNTAAIQCMPTVLSHTQRAYWKEAERFMLWMIIERQTALSSMRGLDCAAYAAFLDAPTPRWCGARGHDKADPRWRPFEGPLTPLARHFALTVVRGLCRFLVEQSYLAANPWNDVKLVKPPVQAQRSNQRFTPDQWQAIALVLNHLPSSSSNQRLRIALHLLYGTGLRLGEAVRAVVDDLQAPATVNDCWKILVISSGNASRLVDLPSVVVTELRHYLRDRGLDCDILAASNRGARLLGRATDALQRAPWAPCARAPFDPKAGISAGSLQDQIRYFLANCTDRGLHNGYGRNTAEPA